MRALLHDPEDGRFDMSRWLLDRKGFLPVPIIVSDPAVGYGGGLAPMFFHRPAGTATTRTTSDGRPQLVPPNLFGGMAMKTENGTQAYGARDAALQGRPLALHRRLALASVNLDFYTPGRFVERLAIGYNTDGLVSFQKIARRLGDEDLFLGLSWIYMDLDLSSDVAGDAQHFTLPERARRASGLGLSLQYDQRDNPFTPGSGWLGMIEGNFYDDANGSDANVQSYRSHAYAYLPISDARFVLGGRADVRWGNGDIPFYRLPFIDPGSVGSARYADTHGHA